MAINFEKFQEWAEKRLGEVVVKGKEIRVNSIFEPDDDNLHLWCSPSGGKKKRKFGVFHCFKTDKKGSLIKLVQLVEKCDREEAISILTGQSCISDLERRLEEIFAQQDNPTEVEPPKPILELPQGSLLISDLPENNWWRKKAEEYLLKRKIPIDGYYICTEAPYKARIIIPYYNNEGQLVYWNGRHISEKAKLRYLGPPKEIGVGKEDVVYMAGSWPAPGSLLYLCEGEFNAKSLFLCEFNAAACGGKNMGEKQAMILSKYKIVFCLDRDKAGKRGTKRMSEIFHSLASSTVVGKSLMYVRPANGYKDWNEMYIELGPAVLHQYIARNQKTITHNSPYGTASDIFTSMELL